jgi:hypothetical protein
LSVPVKPARAAAPRAERVTPAVLAIDDDTRIGVLCTASATHGDFVDHLYSALFDETILETGHKFYA